MGQPKIAFLGNVLVDGVSVDQDKVAAVSWIDRYYCHFVKHYGLLAHLLTELTKKKKKDAFKWSPEAEHTFNHLKMTLTTTLSYVYQILLKPSR